MNKQEKEKKKQKKNKNSSGALFILNFERDIFPFIKVPLSVLTLLPLKRQELIEAYTVLEKILEAGNTVEKRHSEENLVKNWPL